MQPLPLQAVGRFRFSLVAAAFLAAIVGFGLLRDNPMLIGGGLAGTLVALMFAMILGLGLRSLRKQVTAMADGDFVVHWTFSEREWEEHVKRAEGRRRSEVPRYLVIGFVMGSILGGALMAASVYSDGVSWASAWKGPALMGFGLFFLCALVGVVWDLYECLTLRAWRRCSDVYIGARGLYIGGEFWPSRLTHPRFVDIRFEDSPPLLVFDFEIRVKNGAYIKEVMAPVPHGQERRAREVAGWIQTAWK